LSLEEYRQVIAYRYSLAPRDHLDLPAGQAGRTRRRRRRCTSILARLLLSSVVIPVTGVLRRILLIG
jgi:hypothetical protein